MIISCKVYFLRILFFIFLLDDFHIPLAAQERLRGAAAIKEVSTTFKGNTYAIVVGISNYDDKHIPDLKYADRDATAFCTYLKSASGLMMPDSNIKFLINEQATLAAIDDAINWSRNILKKNDRLIIYFAGHGDVEKQTLWQLGYLLAFDTPSGNYRNNAVRLEDINNLVKTVSVTDSIQAQVLIILDACRSGKLSGSDARGVYLTAEQMAKNIANEVRMLSCKADQFSIEDQQWGGGHGLFTFHLINGLFGAADESKDQTITVEEIQDYLKSKMKESLRRTSLPHVQNPVIEGSEQFILSYVGSDSASNALIAQQVIESGDSLLNHDITHSASRSIGRPIEPYSDFPFERLYKILDDQKTVIKPSFINAINQGIPGTINLLLEESRLCKTLNSDSGGMDELEGILQELESCRLVSAKANLFCNKMAVFLHNKGQQRLNLYLKGDAGELQRRSYYSDNESEYERMSMYFLMASKLVEVNHPLYSKLMLKHFYFLGISKRMQSLMDSAHRKDLLTDALALQLKANSLDDKTAYVNNELGILHSSFYKQTEAEQYYRFAIELAPGWAYPYTNLSALYHEEKKYQAAKEMAIKAVQLDSTYALARVRLGLTMMNQGNFLMALENFKQACILDKDHFLPLMKTGELYLHIGQYQKAEAYYMDAENRLKGLSMIAWDDRILNNYPVRPTITYSDYNQQVYTEPKKKAKIDMNDPRICYEEGVQLYKELQYEEAERMFKRVLVLDENYTNIYNVYGELAKDKGDYELSIYLLQKSINKEEDNWETHWNLGSMFDQWNDIEKAERHYVEAIRLNPQLKEPYLSLYNIFFRNERFLDAENIVKLLSKQDQDHANELLYGYYMKMGELFPKDAQWPYKCAIFLLGFDQSSMKGKVGVVTDERPLDNNEARKILNPVNSAKRFEKSLKLLQKCLDLNSEYINKSQLLIKLGNYELNKENYETAKNYFFAALAIDSGAVGAKKALIQIHEQINYYSKTLNHLKFLAAISSLEYHERLLLTKYLLFTGDFVQAKLQLDQVNMKTVTRDIEVTKLNYLFYLFKQDYDAARKYLKLLTKFPMEQPEAYYSIARTYAIKGDKKLARENLQTAMQSGFKYYMVLKYDSIWRDVFTPKGWEQFKADNDLL